MASELETQWIDEYLESGNPTQTVERIYPDTGDNAADKEEAIKARGRYLKHKLAIDIDKRSRELYGKDAPEIMWKLKDLALNSKSETINAKCCIDWLSRAGHDAAQVHEFKDNRTEKELLAKLGTLIDKLDQETIDSLPENVREKLKLIA